MENIEKEETLHQQARDFMNEMNNKYNLNLKLSLDEYICEVGNYGHNEGHEVLTREETERGYSIVVSFDLL